MSYTFAAFVERGDVDETWFPRIVDTTGAVAWSDADGPREHFSATGLIVYRSQVNAAGRQLHEEVELSVHVSRTRLVVAGRQREDGTFLAGQLRWPWLADVGYREKSGRLGMNQLRLVAMDGETGEWVFIDLELAKRDSARRAAEQVLAAAVAARTASADVSDEHRAALAGLALPRYDSASKRFATVRIPGAREVLADTGELEPRESGAALDAPANANAACVLCSAPLPARARFCRACGQRVGSADAPVTEILSAPPEQPRRRWPVLAAGSALLAVLVVTTAVLLTRGGEETPAATASAARASTPVPTPTPTVAAEPTIEVTPAPDVTATPPVAVGSIAAGRYARMGSFRAQDRAQEVVDQLAAKGVTSEAISSNDGEGMLPGFWVVVAGPLDTPADERAIKRAAKKAGIPDTFVDDLSPAAGELDPAALAGTFNGDLQQTNAKVKRLNRKLDTTIDFAADGQSATIAYAKPSCEGTLSLASQEGAVATYDESITRGSCSDGGVWHLRLAGDEVLATWWRENDVTFVIGRLQR